MGEEDKEGDEGTRTIKSQGGGAGVWVAVGGGVG